jgi:hypothetical protein
MVGVCDVATPPTIVAMSCIPLGRDLSAQKQPDPHATSAACGPTGFTGKTRLPRKHRADPILGTPAR